MLEVGEKKGQIIPVLTRLAGDEEKRQQLFRKVLGQITYPLITLALAVPLAQSIQLLPTPLVLLVQLLQKRLVQLLQ